jgi:predicted flap endonuclease-1-like 5' DNA nuclease
MKNPPVLVAVIGFFAALAGFGYLFFGLRVIGFDWFGALGDLPAFEHVGLWGWLAVVTGLIWILAAVGLWALQPWARLFALIMAGFGLFEAALAFFQFPGSGIGLAMALMPGLIFWYLNTREVKAAFAEGEPDATATTTAEPQPVAAPAPNPAVVAATAVVAPRMAAPEPASPPPPVAAPAAMAATTAAHEPVGAAVPTHHMNIVDVEGIGPVNAQKLVAIGILTTDDLLHNGAKAAGRDRIAASAGISEKLVLEWVNNVDLMRVPGVGPQYSDLLEAAGVDSPAELAQRNPANLAVTIQEVIAERPGIVRRTPSEADVAAWVEAARALDKIVEH